MSAAAERHARIRTLELLDGYTFRTASGLYGELLKIDGVGTTTMLHVLRSMEAAREIVVDRSDDGRRVLRYRLATPTAEELDGPAHREIVSVGWDGASQPMLRYRDELELPDHARSIVSALDRDRLELEKLERLYKRNREEHDAGFLQDDQLRHNLREVFARACDVRKRLAFDTAAPQDLRDRACNLAIELEVYQGELEPADDPILVREATGDEYADRIRSDDDFADKALEAYRSGS